MEYYPFKILVENVKYGSVPKLLLHCLMKENSEQVEHVHTGQHDCTSR